MLLRLFLLLALGMASPAQGLTLATYVQTPDQERKAEVLIASLRHFGGRWKDAPIHVVLADPEGLPCSRLKGPGIILHRTDAPPEALRFPYAVKAFAAAQVERLVQGSPGSLAWFDPETMVLAPPEALILREGLEVSLQPVFKRNAVALGPGVPPDAFWSPILAHAGLKVTELPEVRTLVEEAPIRAYYNCGIFAVRPSRRLLQAWKADLEACLAQPEFLRTACGDPAHRIFLHQAVFSACISARVAPSARGALPLQAAYPLHLQEELPRARRVDSLEGLQAVILEQLWDEDPGWRTRFAMNRDQAAWIGKAWARYHQVAPGVFREERSAGCNSLLVRTSQGDVLIDPGGTDHPQSCLLELHGGRALQAILLTHGHADHRAGLARWLANGPVPVIAHRSQAAFLAQLDRIAPAMELRNARLQGRAPRSVPAPATPPPATQTFDARRVLTFGDTRLEMIHVGGETPDTSLVWIPDRKLLCMGDDFFAAFPALSTPRGTQPRPAEQYLDALDLALQLKPEVLVPGHGEPVTGAREVQQALRRYRGALAWVFEATIQGLNEGRSVEELARTIHLPPELSLPETYGRVAWAVRAIAQNHLGWFDGGTASLFEAPASSIHARLVEAAGGLEKVLDLAEGCLRSGTPLEALHLLDLIPDRTPRWRALRIETLKTLLANSRNYFQRALLASELKALEPSGT